MLWHAILAGYLCAGVAVGAPPDSQAPAQTEIPPSAVTVSAATKQPVFPADCQPTFTVTFKSNWTDYINLYDVKAYWNWELRLYDLGKPAGLDNPWRVQFEKNTMGFTAMDQIKPGESLAVDVDLNDPAYTFQYVYQGAQNRPVQPLRHLQPGRYRMELTITLKPPFGPGYHMYVGPATPNALTFTVKRAVAQRPTPEQVKAWDQALDSAAAIVNDRYGLWQNGTSPIVDLPKNASTEDIVAAAVNGTILGSKAYKVLKARALGGPDRKTAVVVQVGKDLKVMVYFYAGPHFWWTRFYDAPAPPKQPS